MQLIGIPSLIAGIILLTAGHHWFPGAATVGLILTIVSAIVLACILIILCSAASILHRRR